jgi:hypothetical protein
LYFFVFLAGRTNVSAAGANDQGLRKIVVFQKGLNDAAKEKLIAHAGGVKMKNLDLIGAKAVWLPSKAAAAKLAAHPEVL